MGLVNSLNGIAITGMSCRFPKAINPEEFWQLLANGSNAFEKIPSDRIETNGYANLLAKGTFLSDPFGFDNEFFKVTEEEAMVMDPQQRIMLELAVEASEHAGYSDWKNKNTGVLIGANQRAYQEMITNSFYQKQLMEVVKSLNGITELPSIYKERLLSELNSIGNVQPLNSMALVGNITNMIAGRISHEFNLQGPSITIDTACSSSLVAVHQACVSLHRRECDIAYAGGININLTHNIFQFMEAAQVISK